jgi:hypothetical protein
MNEIVVQALPGTQWRTSPLLLENAMETGQVWLLYCLVIIHSMLKLLF